MSGTRDRFDLMVFDLDGTLADTREDIASSVNHALGKVGRSPLNLETVTRFVGDGARTLLVRSLGAGAPAGEIKAALEAFLAHYRETCLTTTRLYDGVRETLDGLSQLTLAVLTNKPRDPTLKILRALEIEDRFRWVQCGDDPLPRKPDPRGLLHLVSLAGCEPSRALFIGDSAVDIATGNAAGVPVGFVTYGFRPDAIEGASVEIVLADLRELLEL